MNKPLDDILAKMLAAADQIKRVDDNLLMAIAAIAATGNVQVVEMQSLFGYKPVIMLPPHMYNRMLELIPPTEPQS